MNAETVTNDQIIERALLLRDEIAARKKAFTVEITEYENALEACENYLLRVMQDRNEDNIKTSKGTAFKSKQMRVTMADREMLIRDFVLEPILHFEAIPEESSGRESDDFWSANSDLSSTITEIIHRLSIFTNHVAKEVVKEIIESEGRVPPGIDVQQFIACHIRKP